MPLTAEQVGKLTDQIKESQTTLETCREEMGKRNDQVDELIKEHGALKKDGGSNGVKIEAVEKDLVKQGESMQELANKFSNLNDRFRKQTSVMGHDGGNEQSAFIYRHPKAKGAVFQCKQEAVELGMYFLATMPSTKDSPGRRFAVQWLGDRGKHGDLKYIPNMPKSLVEEIGREWAEKVTQSLKAAGDYGDLPQIVQDLTGGATPGSVLTRPEFSNTLIRNIEEHGVFRRNALVWPMGADTVYIPRRSGGFTTYWVGENVAPTESDPAFQQLGMTAKKEAILHQYSSELNEDAVLSLADIIMFEVALAYAESEDNIGFNGTGTSTYAGFVGVLGAAANATAATADSSFVPHQVTGASGNNLTSEITEAKLREMTGRLHEWARGNAKWYIHRTVLADMDGIQMGTAGGSVVKYQDPRSPTIMGFPVEVVEKLPVAPSEASKHVFALGDLRRSWILGDRRQVRIETSEHFAFDTDQITLKVTARKSFLMQSGNGMVVYETGTA